MEEKDKLASAVELTIDLDDFLVDILDRGGLVEGMLRLVIIVILLL